MTTKDEKVRLNIVMPQKTKQLIDDLQDRTGAGSMSELIRRALALLDIVTAKQKEGGEPCIRWPDGTYSPMLFVP